MLDTMKIGLLCLDTKNEKPGYMRVIPKSNPNAVMSHFRIPLHVVFDLEGYNSYKQFTKKQNPELRTWVHDVVITVPPIPEHADMLPNAGHEWFLAHMSEVCGQSSAFPASIKGDLESAVREYLDAKKETEPVFEEWDVYDESRMTKAQKIAAVRAVELYGRLQRSRFDPGRNERKGEFEIPPFVRDKEDESAHQVIENITQTVSQRVWRDPKVSKYSETEGAGLKIMLSVLFLEAIYKEQMRFMRGKLGIPSRVSVTKIRRKPL